MAEILALVTDAYGGTGGIALYNRDALRAMAEAPDVTRVHCLPRVIANPTESIPDKVTFHAEAARGTFRYLKSLTRIWRASGSIKLVYCAHTNLVPVAWLMAKLLRVPWTLCLYGVEAWTPTMRQPSQWMSGRANRVMAISRVTLDRFLAWNQIDPARCSIVPNALHQANFQVLPRDATLAASLGLTGRKVILTLGRLHPLEQAKGFDHVINALPELHKSNPALTYLIVGSGGDRARLEALAETRGVRDAVVFAGFVPEAEKAKYYALADAYVMPSKMEGFGFVFLEAMACGLPVVGSAIDGGRDALLDGKLGQLVDPGDQKALVHAILRAVDMPRHVPPELNNFSFSAFSEKVQRIVSQTINAEQ